ncbi:hypothetical protein QTG56_14690 [Rossellomorea sp. AcN35-11]|nr:hypothetical protein QTG56_14690 [Rossellomorea sp. AcN35-11]
MVDGEENLDLLRRKIKDQLKNDKNLSPYVFEEYLEKALEDPNDWKWSIDTNYFRMYFDEYEIAAGACRGDRSENPYEGSAIAAFS